MAPPPARDPSEFAQDIFLLWPGELVGTDGVDGADPALRQQVETAGFKVLVHGRVPFSARNRLQMGTGAGAAGRLDLGSAFFVTFARPEGLARGAKPATYIRIPWKPELASLDWVPRLELAAKGAITPRRVSWLEEAFWGRRNIITLSFGDVGYSSLYPLYYGNRDRVIPLAADFSRLMINFAEANHLKIDEVVPSTALRRLSETRENTDTFSIPLIAADGIVPAGAEGAVRLLPGTAALAAHPALRAAPGPGQSHRPDRRQPAPQARPDPARSGPRRARGGRRARPRRGAVAGGARAHPARRDAPTRTCSGWWAARPRRSSACPSARSAR